MNVTFLGAVGEVTGSGYLVQTDQAKVLVDFGLFQGVRKADQKNRLLAGLKPSALDAVLITHAHLDHTGRLPLLGKAGYQGTVFATPASIDMAGLILRDSAKVQAQDLERANRKRARAGREPLLPLYAHTDVEAILSCFQSVPYIEPVDVAPGITARFVEAGHMLGSASIQLRVQEADRVRTLVFSGDLGPRGAPILRDAEPFHQADVVFLESTYGDHDHKPLQETVDEFMEILKQAVANRGKILVPTFAVGRAQLLLLILALMFRKGVLAKFPIFLDSPMAIEASRIYTRHPELFDEEMTQTIKDRPLEADLSSVRATATAEESKAINDVPGPCLILAGAGMCNAGRILHHIRQNIWRPETHVIIVGYQAEGTVGRRLVEGDKFISVFGEKLAVKARVHTLGGFSAHAGQTDLIRWFDAMASSRPEVVLTHGEDKARAALSAKIEAQYGLRCQLPGPGSVLEV